MPLVVTDVDDGSAIAGTTEHREVGPRDRFFRSAWGGLAV